MYDLMSTITYNYTFTYKVLYTNQGMYIQEYELFMVNKAGICSTCIYLVLYTGTLSCLPSSAIDFMTSVWPTYSQTSPSLYLQGILRTSLMMRYCLCAIIDHAYFLTLTVCMHIQLFLYKLLYRAFVIRQNIFSMCTYDF